MTKINAANWIAAARQSSPQASAPQPSMVFARRPAETTQGRTILRAVA